MATDGETLDAEILRRMTYSELKKVAKKHGVKGNMKAEKIISTLISVNSDDLESFTTPLQTGINSSRKNKEKKFDEDRRTPLDTPRRGTYTVESPSECYWIVKDDLNTASSALPAAPAPPIPVSVPLTPVSSATTVDASFTPVSSPAVNMSIEDMINVTTVRGSERKLRPRKVSFLSPKKTPRSPKYLSLKDRPKTPIASRLSTSKRVSFSTPVGQQRRKSLEKVLRVTPHPSSAKSINNSISTKTSSSNCKSKVKQTATPSSSRIIAGEQQSAKLKRKATPNFKEIHQKAFDKMESIDDYQKRKNLNSAKKLGKGTNLKTRVIKAKSKIPVPFSGIPFIPSASSTTAMSFNFASRTMKDVVPETKNVVSKLQKRSSLSSKTEAKRRTEALKENTSHKSKTKFDLKASLSKKLGYRPYTGKVKPLAESNSDHSKAACIHKPKEIQNKVVSKNRLQSRSLLKGVRTNKRFELQMKNRKCE